MKVDTKKGLMPVILSENMESLLSKIPIKMPISSLLDTDNSSGGSIYISLNAGFTNTLNNVSIFHLKNMFLSLPKVNFTKLTDLEKKKATDTFVINNYTINFYYETSDVNIQQ